jgi:crossover junction endodeoxyribonuclease RuvC
VSSSFNFGASLGSILSAIQILQLPMEFVTPARWKASLGLDREKTSALHRARLLFPTAELARQKDHGRAEALLLAHWGQTRFCDQYARE